MPVEIERKFLVCSDAWTSGGGEGTPYRQGYVYAGPPVSVRVRTAGSRAYLTLKTDQGAFSRLEYEYEIPLDHAREMLDRLCEGRVVDKTRYRVPWEGHEWEVDVFHGANRGLVMAELELETEADAFERPPWLGEEVTGDHRYLNSYLSQHPFTSWA